MEKSLNSNDSTLFTFTSRWITTIVNMKTLEHNYKVLPIKKKDVTGKKV